MAATGSAPQRSDGELLSAYANGEVSARDELAERYMPLARRLAARYRGTSEDRADLEQTAYVALLKAIDRCDTEIGEFITFAITNIRGELKRHFRDHGWGVYVSRPQKESWLQVRDAMDALTSRTGRSPTVNEIAAHLRIAADTVVQALEVSQSYRPLGLDAPLTSEDGEGTLTLADSLGHEETRFAYIEVGTAIAPAFDALTDLQKRIIRLRFIDDLTQTEIGSRLDVSQMQVSRQLRQALDRLGSAMEAA